jgi:hypothetical protein
MSTSRSRSKSKFDTDKSDNKESWWYGPSADYGKFVSVIGFVITLILFIAVLYGVNFFLYSRVDPYGEKIIKGKIKDVSCNRYTTSSGEKNNITTNYDCNLDISYNINNIDYNKKNHIINSTTYYNKGSIIDLRYNKDDPNDITENTWSYNNIGNIIVIVFFIIMIFSIINLIAVFLFKPAAAAVGIASLGGTVAKGVATGINR